MNTRLTAMIDNFDSVSLEQLNEVKLLNRTDTKYVFHRRVLCNILDVMDDYSILNIEGDNLFNYETIYYDTKDSNMFLMHHNGKLNRYKIRKRDYVESKIRYMEIKFKNNKGRTIKKRIETNNLSNTLSDIEREFILKNSPYDPGLLEPKLLTVFKRLTLTNKKKTERITIDFDLLFKDDASKKELSNICIMEIKQDRLNKDSRLVKILRNMKIQSGSMSKYCFATGMLNSSIKINNFKPKLIKLQKIENA